MFVFALVSDGQWGELAFGDLYPAKMMANHKNVQTTILSRPAVLHTSRDWPDSGVPCLCALSPIGTTQQILHVGSHVNPLVAGSWQERHHVSLLSEVQGSVSTTTSSFWKHIFISQLTPKQSNSGETRAPEADESQTWRQTWSQDDSER